MTESLSIVIPVYRSQAILPELYAQLVRSLNQIGTPYEIILVEDCGGDGSWDVIKELVGRDPRVRGFRLSRNHGQQNATLCGIRAARHDIIVTMDDDLQHRPDQIPALLARLEEGYDVVYGVPETQQHGFWRDGAAWLTKLGLRVLAGNDTAGKVNSFRCFRAVLRDAFSAYQSPVVDIDGLLTWGTDRFAAVVTAHSRRHAGESTYTFWKLVGSALDTMTGLSTVPLRLTIAVGFLFIAFGIGVLGWVLITYLISGSQVPGFTFLATIITVFAGIQLFTLGIFGEYLARIFGRSLDRPPFVISERIEMTKSRVVPLRIDQEPVRVETGDLA
jgi:glycosyltransferase involved in cell wall biosynthesis